MNECDMAAFRPNEIKLWTKFKNRQSHSLYLGKTTTMAVFGSITTSSRRYRQSRPHLGHSEGTERENDWTGEESFHLRGNRWKSNCCQDRKWELGGQVSASVRKNSGIKIAKKMDGHCIVICKCTKNWNNLNHLSMRPCVNKLWYITDGVIKKNEINPYVLTQVFKMLNGKNYRKVHIIFSKIKNGQFYIVGSICRGKIRYIGTM